MIYFKKIVLENDFAMRCMMYEKFVQQGVRNCKCFNLMQF